MPFLTALPLSQAVSWDGGLAGELTFHDCASLSVKPGVWHLHPIGTYRKPRTSPAGSSDPPPLAQKPATFGQYSRQDSIKGILLSCPQWTHPEPSAGRTAKAAHDIAANRIPPDPVNLISWTASWAGKFGAIWGWKSFRFLPQNAFEAEICQTERHENWPLFMRLRSTLRKFAEVASLVSTPAASTILRSEPHQQL